MKLTEKIKENVTEIENRSDLSEQEKVDRLIVIGATFCSGLAIQPIPFADIFILTPVQAYFASRIAKVRQVPISESEFHVFIKELMGIVGMGIIAQNLGMAISKIAIPVLGNLLTIPLVFSLSYAILKVCDIYFQKKQNGTPLNPDEIKELFKKYREEGKTRGKGINKSDIEDLNK
jgi:uncharacterized protein (DUF697 family)